MCLLHELTDPIDLLKHSLILHGFYLFTSVSHTYNVEAIVLNPDC